MATRGRGHSTCPGVASKDPNELIFKLLPLLKACSLRCLTAKK